MQGKSNEMQYRQKLWHSVHKYWVNADLEFFKKYCDSQANSQGIKPLQCRVMVRMADRSQMFCKSSVSCDCCVPPNPQESWEEEGEVSEGQRPRLHPAGERLVTGHSLTVQPWNRTEPNPRQGHVTSPGQLTLQSAGRTGTARQCFSFHSTSVPPA